MKLIIIIILIAYVTLCFGARGHLLDQLEQDIRDQYLDDFSHIEAALIISGILHKDSLNIYLRWYDDLIEKIKKFPADPANKIAYAEKIFIYLHSIWLKEYKKESTTLRDIIRHKQYNCVAATILYNLVCEDVQIGTKAFETPTHVYTVFSEWMLQSSDIRKNIIVENTSSMGFDMLKNLKSYSQYLARFYPENTVLKIGLDRLYLYEHSKGREISNTELLGLLAYNQAYFAAKKGNFKKAYQFVQLAQRFNKDSRSNIEFELGLYFRWGRQLFENNNYSEAFQVYRDGFNRYPANQDLIQNVRASFFQSLQVYWKEKKWDNCPEMINQMIDLEILGDEDLKNIQMYLTGWITYLIRIKDKDNAGVAVTTYEQIFGPDQQSASFRNTLNAF